MPIPAMMNMPILKYTVYTQSRRYTIIIFKNSIYIVKHVHRVCVLALLVCRWLPEGEEQEEKQNVGASSVHGDFK
jgi:hypothetical protein